MRNEARRQLTSAPERLLVVDDDPNNRTTLSRRLAQRGFAVDVAEDPARVLEKIARAQYDLVLLDPMMPGMNALDLLHLLRATYAPGDLPVIMVAALDHSQTVLNALQRRNGDASHPALSAPAESFVSLDPLTGLGDRLMLLDRLAVMSASEPFVDRPARGAVLLLDLDGFKVVNDSLGNAVGDRILREVATRLTGLGQQNALPASVARIGGGVFGMVLEGAAEAEAADFAEAVLDRMRQPFPAGGREITINASLGVTVADGTRPAPEDLLRDADLAMFRAKELGKDRWHLFRPELRERALTKMTIVQDLRHAIERGQLFAAYQAKVDLRTRSILGFEALARWQHPERGLLMPATFIPLAEETGLILPLGEWILGEACAQLKRWQTRFPMTPPLTMSVNLSVKQLADPSLVDRVRDSLARTGIPPESLRLELTESALMTDLDSSRAALSQMQELGIGLKLDDFGTGYSSFSYLRSLRFNSLKIDQSFVARMNLDNESEAIVDSIIRLAHALDMTVVAEGIEQPEQAEVLARLGCDAGQGFYFSRPVEASRAEQQLFALYGGRQEVT